MALKYIIQEFSKQTGISIRDSGSRASCIEKINRAARELYDSADLPGCLREQVFSIDKSEKQITLPYYVGQIRGVRNYENRDKITANDMRPRYFSGTSGYQNSKTWRIKHKSALGRELPNESQLSFVLQDPCDEPFSIVINGSTQTADKFQETVVFGIGESEITTLKTWTPFPGVDLISKDKPTSSNLEVYAGDTLVAEIANNELESFYTLIQVLDNKSEAPVECECYEILYKHRLPAFRNDYDDFPCKDFDDAILWKAVAHYFQNVPGAETKVIAAEQRLAGIISQKFTDSSDGIEKEMQFASNRFFGLSSGGFYKTGSFN